jgi:Fe-S cluster assembly protein SufD
MINLNEYKSQFSASGENAVVREQALSSAISMGLPKARMENWRYTNLKPVVKQYFKPALSKLKLSKASLPTKVTTWPRLVFQNSMLLDEMSDKLPTGVTISKGSQIKQDMENPDQVFEYLNFALNSGGLNINVNENANIDGIEVLFIFDGQKDEALHLRNTINMGKGGELSILMNYCDQFGQLGWLNATNDLTIDEGAKLVHYSQISSANGSFLNIRDLATIKGGRYENHSLLAAAPSARHEINFITAEENSQALLNGAFLATKGETLDTLTRAMHLKPKCHSEQFFKGIVALGGKTTFQGKVFVEKDAQKTVANQSCKNIILDHGAQANVKPELLIYADDVKCAHGTTVGELDENALFYLEQRGISPVEARGILVNAFLEEIIDKIPAKEIQTSFRDEITKWMSEN